MSVWALKHECVSLLKTRGEKGEEKMKKKRKRKKKEIQLCSKQCRRVGPEQKTFHTQKKSQNPSNTKKTPKNDFWFLVFFYWLVWFIFLGWVGFGFETPTANPDVTLPSLKLSDNSRGCWQWGESVGPGVSGWYTYQKTRLAYIPMVYPSHTPLTHLSICTCGSLSLRPRKVDSVLAVGISSSKPNNPRKKTKHTLKEHESKKYSWLFWAPETSFEWMFFSVWAAASRPRLHNVACPSEQCLLFFNIIKW